MESLGSVAITDAEGRYVWVSHQRIEKSGMSREELIGRYVRDLYPNTLVDQVIRTSKPVLLHPIQDIRIDTSQQVFVSYYPLIKENCCLGCFLYVTMPDMRSALDFSHTVAELTHKLHNLKNGLLDQLTTAHYSTGNIIGNSPAIQQLKNEIQMAARTTSNVLIQGETGTGKELVAHAIHEMSLRSEYPFVRVNCSAIPESLMESEFFGYESGSFTGASKKAGRENLSKRHADLFFLMRSALYRWICSPNSYAFCRNTRSNGSEERR